MVEAEAARRISTTPIPKLDAGLTHTNAVTPLERIPRVDEDHCVGCNLCSLVCPVDNCITMERIDNGLPPQTWEERVTAAIVPQGVEHTPLPNPNTSVIELSAR
jgi:dihydropyrimidine dehydrogenase (NAD+) subunit PreA